MVRACIDSPLDLRECPAVDVEERRGIWTVVAIPDGQCAPRACKAMLALELAACAFDQDGLLGVRDVELEDGLALCGSAAIPCAYHTRAVCLAARQKSKGLVDDENEFCQASDWRCGAFACVPPQMQ